MVQFYKVEQLHAVEKQKKKTLRFYFIMLGVYVFLSTGLFLWFLTLPYQSSDMNIIRWSEFLITSAFVVFSFLHLGIKYKRVKKFYRMLMNLETGRREATIGSFFEYDNTVMVKDGVDVKSLIFLEWNKYKSDFFERKVLVLAEMEFPKFIENQNVKYVTQGNVLVEYEILPD